jgi:hypothetical protein
MGLQSFKLAELGTTYANISNDAASNILETVNKDYSKIFYENKLSNYNYYTPTPAGSFKNNKTNNYFDIFNTSDINFKSKKEADKFNFISSFTTINGLGTNVLKFDLMSYLYTAVGLNVKNYKITPIFRFNEIINSITAKNKNKSIVDSIFISKFEENKMLNHNFFDLLNNLFKEPTHFLPNKTDNLFYGLLTDKETNEISYSAYEVDDNMYYNYDELDDTWDVEFNMRHQVNSGAIRVVKHMLTPEYLSKDSDLLKFNYFENANQTAEKLPDNDSNYWVLKQKRYKKKQIINASKQKDLENMSFNTVRNIYKKHIIENIKLIQDLDFLMDPYSLYKCVRNNRARTESLPVHLYRRLLRTKRTLVLPVHVNMTVVTNSYDVVHS